MSGFFKLNREFFDHWVAQDPEYGFAWIFIVGMCEWEDTTRMVGGHLVHLHRGETALTYRYLSKRMGWTICKTQTFMRRLISEKMLAVRIESGVTISTVINYAKYQDVKHCEDEKNKVVREQYADSTPIVHGQYAGSTNIKGEEVKNIRTTTTPLPPSLPERESAPGAAFGGGGGDMVSVLVSEGVAPGNAAALVEQYGEAAASAGLEYARQTRRQAKNWPAWVVNAIRGGFTPTQAAPKREPYPGESENAPVDNSPPNPCPREVAASIRQLVSAWDCGAPRPKIGRAAPTAAEVSQRKAREAVLRRQAKALGG